MPNNKIFTVGDLPVASVSVSVSGEAAGRGDSRGSGDGSGPLDSLLRRYHIPTLPSSDQASSMLERVVREFDPIVKRRKYVVLSVSELCCCGDGLDSAPTASGGRRRRKRRMMSRNVWGYNQITTTNRGGRKTKTHTIHLRLRHAADHGKFLCYEDVAGTMAHELAHCEHEAHNDRFYSLMDEILEEHAVLMASSSSSAFTMGGVTAGALGLPSFSGEGRTVGGGVGNNGLRRARERQQQALDKGAAGHKLGGDGAFQRWMSPAEAAAVAAEARRRQKQLRLRGDRCCRPCTIDLCDEDNDNSGGNDKCVDNDKVPSKRKHAVGNGHSLKPAAVTTAASVKRGCEAARRPTATSAAPLAAAAARARIRRRQDQSNRTEDKRVIFSPKKAKTDPEATANAKNLPVTAASAVIDLTENDNSVRTASVLPGPPRHWACSACTFLNSATYRSCTMCQLTERPSPGW